MNFSSYPKARRRQATKVLIASILLETARDTAIAVSHGIPILSGCPLRFTELRSQLEVPRSTPLSATRLPAMPNANFGIDQRIRFNTKYTFVYSYGFVIRCLFFKEIFHPQLPLRMPCYDFTPVTDSTLTPHLCRQCVLL